eukprot:TRINITY_DN423_c0_g1_i2.p1 TRINITY_DN423_c0_g1~~TRINITY_DN423_c0_g1_i2.p1  ORF type:complete len:327 (+),score=47.19 TRINITY_DN423_c0_g1_i2:855-1835(+)
MPTNKEVITMTQVLWDEYRTPHRWQRGKINTPEEKVAEIEKRIELVGTIPRLLFDSALFVRAIEECLYSAKEAAQNVSDSDLYNAMFGKYTPFVGKHPASASGRIFFLCAEPVYHETWEERRLYRPVLKLTPVATVVLHDRLKKRVEALRKEKFEDFAFDWVCMREGRHAEVHHGGTGTHDAAYLRIASLRREDMRLYRPVAENFAFVDFATSITTWYNAKSTSGNAAYVYVNNLSASRFLAGLEQAAKEMFSVDEINKMLEHGAVSLTVITNGCATAKFKHPETSVRLFNAPVSLQVINATEEVATQPLNARIDRTRMLLEEFNF